MTVLGQRYFLCLLGLLWPFLPACSKRETASAPAEKILRISQRNEPATLDPQLATLPEGDLSTLESDER